MITKQRINLARVIVAALLLSLIQTNAYISQSGAVVVNEDSCSYLSIAGMLSTEGNELYV